MSSTAYWVIGLIILFLIGSVTGLRLNPREKALGQLRERARKMGLHPRLIAAPDWIDHRRTNGERGGMVAFYHVIIPQGQLPLVQAKIQDQQIQVVRGDTRYNRYPFTMTGMLAVEMQANSIGVYWDEERDLHGVHLEALKQALLDLAAYHAK
jgi:hypothetical protein